MVGGYDNTDIDVIDALDIETADNSDLWSTSSWQSDSNYGTIDDMASLQQQVQIGQYLYMAGVGFGKYTDRLLIYDLKTQQQVDSSNYDYVMPISVERTCMSLVLHLLSVVYNFYCYYAVLHNTQFRNRSCNK